MAHLNLKLAKWMPKVLVSFLLLCITFMPLAQSAAQNSPQLPTAAELSATFAVEWMHLLYQRVEADGVSAPAASRIYAYAGITLYEAILAGMPDNNTLSGQLTNLPDMPLPNESISYDWHSSANGALATVLSSLLPSDGSLKAFALLRDSQIKNRKEAVSADVLERSLAYGESIGKALLDWIAKDHFQETRNKEYKIPEEKPQDWGLTTAGTKPVEPYWGQIRPFALESSDRCNFQLNMHFDTDPSSTFYAQAMEVKTAGEKLTDEQKAIADFWVDTSGITGTPAGHWISISSQLVQQLKLRLNRAAEMYTLVGIAVGDAFISCWDLKYQAVLLRPETYIKKYIRRTWAPYIQTPPFPSYPSGHSVVSAAAASVLTGMFGTVAFKDDTHRIHGQPARYFTSFVAAANEAAISRLYGGIHYRVDIENGLVQGRCVGLRVLESVQLRPRPQGQG